LSLLIKFYLIMNKSQASKQKSVTIRKDSEASQFSLNKEIQEINKQFEQRKTLSLEPEPEFAEILKVLANIAFQF
jgi:hypothetical protein